jgi:hypothetical protein
MNNDNILNENENENEDENAIVIRVEDVYPEDQMNGIPQLLNDSDILLNMEEGTNTIIKAIAHSRGFFGLSSAIKVNTQPTPQAK